MDEDLSVDGAIENTIDDAVQQVTAPLSDYISGPVLKIISVLVILIAGLIILKVLLHIVQKALDHSRFDDVLHTFVISSIKVVFSVMLVLTVLGYLGIPMTPFITMMGACGAAVALALKDSLGNFAGGIPVSYTHLIIKGYIAAGADASNIIVCGHHPEKLEAMKSELGITIAPDVSSLTDASDAVMVAVKPKDMAKVLAEAAPRLKESQLIISIAAGKSIMAISEMLDSAAVPADKRKIIRVMPNTCLLYTSRCV